MDTSNSVGANILAKTETIVVAGRSLEQWEELARQDDCFNYMVPSDLRQLVGLIKKLKGM